MSGAFNCDLCVQEEVKRIINTLNIKYVIETGTSCGKTTEWFSNNVSHVSTTEIVKETYDRNLITYSNLNNIKWYLGSSDIILDQMIKNIKSFPNYNNEPILFYLDAHWYDNWPLLKELDTIALNCKNNAIIIIDDFKVPNLNKSYDSYKSNSCSLEYIKNNIVNVFDQFVFYFNYQHISTSAARNDNGGFNDVGKIYIFPILYKDIITNFTNNYNGYNYSNLSI